MLHHMKHEHYCVYSMSILCTVVHREKGLGLQKICTVILQIWKR